MRYLIKGLFLVGLMFASSSAWSAGAWTGKQSIDRLYPSTVNAFVRLSSTAAMINPGGCNSNYYFVVDPSLARFKEQYQTLLTAVAAGKVINLYIDGCIGNYPRIRYLMIYPT